MKDASCGVIPILKSNNSVLLIQTLEGKWGFPKGHPELGETSVQTALRELAEETGITDCELLQEKLFEEHYQFEKEGITYDKTNTLYIGFVQNPELHIQKEELLDGKWFPYQEALERIDFPEAKNVLEEVLIYLGF